MGIFREFSEGLALSQQSPFVTALGVVAASVFAVHWIRKNAAPRLREQRRARTFDRVLETARGLEELAGMRNLTEEQQASFRAALVENGEGVALPKAATSTEPDARDEPAVEAKEPPPWFLDRVERLIDAGARCLMGLGAIGLGAMFFFPVYDMTARELDAADVIIGILASLLGSAFVVGGVRIIAKQVGVDLGFIDEAKVFLLAKLTPPDWVQVIFFLALFSMPYLLPIGLFVHMVHWCLTTSGDVRPDEWVFTAVCGSIAVGAVVKAVQKIRGFFYFPDDSSSSSLSPAEASYAS